MTLVSFLCRNILYCASYIHFLFVVVIVHVLVIVKDVLYNDADYVINKFKALSRETCFYYFGGSSYNLDWVINLWASWPSASLA